MNTLNTHNTILEGTLWEPESRGAVGKKKKNKTIMSAILFKFSGYMNSWWIANALNDRVWTK